MNYKFQALCVWCPYRTIHPNSILGITHTFIKHAVKLECCFENAKRPTRQRTWLQADLLWLHLRKRLSGFFKSPFAISLLLVISCDGPLEDSHGYTTHTRG